jgi:alcohol dehydrogenase (cytochrome c)
MNRMFAALLALCLTTSCSMAPKSQTSVLSVGWPSYNRTLHSERFSELRAIDSKTIGDLRVLCEASLGDPGSFQANPIVIDDTLFVTTVHTVVALDASDCTLRWRYVYTAVDDEPNPGNRGVAYLDGRLFRGTNDGRLLALDAVSGQELWRVQIADPSQGEFVTAAPIAWNDLVFIGPAGSDWGIRGRLMAFDARTGEERWRFNTVPLPGEPGFETWLIPETAEHGGGGTWSSYTLDPVSGEFFAPVGNPAPNYNPGARPGRNLYTNSLVVLDARTGALKWFYQLSPNDGFDYDLAAAPVLFMDAAGNRRVALGSKDGYLYVIDRGTHELVFKTAITTILNPVSPPTPQGVRGCPGAGGGVQWNGPAYNPITKLLYVGSVDWCSVFTSGEQQHQAPLFYGGTAATFDPAEAKSGWIYAVDAESGQVVWRHHADSPVLSGATSTASDILFSGTANGDLLAFDARSGELVLKQDMGASMAGGVITYAVKGRQFVATTAGNISRSGWAPLRNTVPRVIVLTTGLAPATAPNKVVVQDSRDTAGFGGNPGRATFNIFCAGCHGLKGTGASGPSLKTAAKRDDAERIAAFIRNPSPAMPNLYLNPLLDSDVEAVARYLADLY